MAQNFRRYTSNNVGTSPATVFTANSYDTVIGISLSSDVITHTLNTHVYYTVFILFCRTQGAKSTQTESTQGAQRTKIERTQRTKNGEESKQNREVGESGD